MHFTNHGTIQRETIPQRCLKIKVLKSILPLIAKYCPDWHQFNVYLKSRRSVPEFNEEFLRLFSSKLKYISCGQKMDINLLPNLISIAKNFVCIPERVVGLNQEFERIKFRFFGTKLTFVSRSVTNVPQNQTFES